MKHLVHAVIAAFFMAPVVLPGTLASAAELALDEIEETIKSFKTVHGRAISEAEVWEILSQSKEDIPPKEYRELWSMIRETQAPSISLEQLLLLVKSKRDSIQTVEARTHVERVFFAEDGQISTDRSYKQSDHFIFARQKLFCETERKTRGIKIPSATYRVSFDGEKIRKVNKPDGNLPNATVTEPSSAIATILPDPNPLSAAMLLDSQLIYKMPVAHYDLAGYIELMKPTLYEELVVLDETKCLLLEDGATYRLFLDPSRDCSVVRMEFYHRDFFQGGKIRVTKGRSVEKIVELKDLKDFGNGVFLPREIIDTFFVEGRKAVVATLKVEDLGVNREFADEVFSGIIPDSAIVADHTQGHGGAVYKQSDSASIGGLLKETTKSKRSTTLRHQDPIDAAR